jgi:hypothetical protein
VSDSDIFPAYRPPDWYPLQRALALVFGTASFWFIGFVHGPADVGELRLYEYSATKGRIALDRTGDAYRWIEDIGGYCRVDHEAALIDALV